MFNHKLNKTLTLSAKVVQVYHESLVYIRSSDEDSRFSAFTEAVPGSLAFASSFKGW
jgi:hypothetical protein